jgi:hypothetical protein
MRVPPGYLLRIVTAALVGGTLLAGCDLYRQDSFEAEYIVEAYLVADRPLPPIRLSRSAPIDAMYEFAALGVRQAEVRVHLLGPDGSVETSWPYVPVAAGIYEPRDPGAPVLSERRYRLEVVIPESGHVLTAETFVPGLFELLRLNTDTVGYQSPQQLEITVTPSRYPGRQSYYTFTTVALDTVNYDLTPFYAGFIDDNDRLRRSDVARNSSGVLNESNFDTNEEGHLVLRLPWIAIAFYGPNQIVSNAIDDNLYDFLRSIQGSFTQSPGQLENAINHVEGGRGIFGSMAESSATVYVRRPPGS